MKMLMSPAMRDVFVALGHDGKSSPELKGERTIFGKFPSVFSFNSLFLWSEKISNQIDVERHREFGGFSDLNVALVDIELRENKLHAFCLEKYVRPKSLRDAVTSALLGLEEVYKNLTEEVGERDWIVWSSIQPQIGDYEAELNDLKSINLSEVMQQKKPWWYGVDFSFSKYRAETDDFLKDLILNGSWGETLSPFNFLFVPNHFQA